jgi:hypothetical protein
MHYRSFTTPSDFSRDVATFVTFLGEAEYRRLLRRLGEGLNKKGYVTKIDDLRFSLELELLNLELLRQSVARKFAGWPERIHEAADFVIGPGQTIPHLSTRARTKLRGQIVGGLKTNGLRPLQHEMRIAAALSNIGCEVSFADLEGAGRYDILAEKGGIHYEVEGKSLSVFSGHPIQPHDAEKLFREIRRHFVAWKDRTRIPDLVRRCRSFGQLPGRIS